MERLGIGGPELTDEGLRHLVGMSKLDHFTIDDGNITDQGLTYLQDHQRLGYLNITSRKRISPSAKRSLREHLPDLATFSIQLKEEDAPRKADRIR